jgi:hypothetical protein
MVARISAMSSCKAVLSIAIPPRPPNLAPPELNSENVNHRLTVRARFVDGDSFWFISKAKRRETTPVMTPS